MSAPVQPATPPAQQAVALLTYAWWFIAVALLASTLFLAVKARADRRSGCEPNGVMAGLITSALASAAAFAVAVILSDSLGSAVLDVLLWAWSVCVTLAPYLALLAALAVLPFFLSPMPPLPPASPSPPKVSLVKAPRPFDLATELGRAGRLLPEDEHRWWVTVQAPVLLAAELAAVYTRAPHRGDTNAHGTQMVAQSESPRTTSEGTGRHRMS